MPQDHTRIDQLIQRCLDGQCTPEEQAQLKQLLQQHGLDEEELPMAQDLPSALQSERMYRRIREGIGHAPVYRNTTRPLWPAWAAAAAAVLLIAISGIWLSGKYRFAENRLAAHTLYNNSDTVRMMQLEDGSRVWLNSHARLSWQGNDFAHHRNLRLNGEAYFEVAHDQAHPFTVVTGGLKTMVLGTSFNVRCLPGGADVALFSGKVRLSAQGTTATRTLHPGDAVQYREDQHRFSNGSIPFHTLAWKTGELKCNNEPLEQVLDYLGRYYHTPIHNERNLDHLKFSGSVSLRVPLREVLEQVLFVHQLQYRTHLNEIVVY